MRESYKNIDLEEDDDIIYRAMYDTYLIILSKYSFEEIAARHEAFDEDVILFINAFNILSSFAITNPHHNDLIR